MSKRRAVKSPTLAESQMLEIAGLRSQIEAYEDALGDLVIEARNARFVGLSPADSVMLTDAIERAESLLISTRQHFLFDK